MTHLRSSCLSEQSAAVPLARPAHPRPRLFPLPRSTPTSRGWPRRCCTAAHSFVVIRRAKATLTTLKLFCSMWLRRTHICVDTWRSKALLRSIQLSQRSLLEKLSVKKGLFLTRKWDADEDVDRKHWGKFKPFYKYAKNFNSDDFDYEALDNSDYVFMRWKEQFLVPDHTIKDISGASFAGFYYICFQKSTATIEGYYYHRSSEWYQSLNLNHVREHSVPIYEFRWQTDTHTRIESREGTVHTALRLNRTGTTERAL